MARSSAQVPEAGAKDRRRCRIAATKFGQPWPVDILMLSDVYFPRVNGVSSSIRSFAHELVRRGHGVTLVAPAYGETAPAEPFELIRLPGRRVPFDPEDRLVGRAAVRTAAAALARRRWDVVHVHTPFRAHALGRRVARRTGRPLVASYHTWFEQYARHYLPWLPDRLLRAGARALSRRHCRALDHLVVPSREMAGVLAGYGIATPVTVLPTGLDLSEFSGGDGAAFRARHGIAADRPVLVTVSRLAAEKNIGFLLEVTRRLRDAHPDLLLLVAGEGPDARRLQQQAAQPGLAGHVRFFGNLDRRGELLDCYRAGDVFVFASPTETQGLVLIEASALGVPVVSTAVMGTATVLADARGAVVAPPDLDGFAAAVDGLLRDPSRRAALAAAGPQDAARWSAPALARRLEALYQDLADAVPAPRATA